MCNFEILQNAPHISQFMNEILYIYIILLANHSAVDWLIVTQWSSLVGLLLFVEPMYSSQKKVRKLECRQLLDAVFVYVVCPK
jgi:hypothetical protein